jgi:ribosomal protein S6--L-glutamate ligase
MSDGLRPFTVGWAEWVSLPDLGVPAIKAKIDTGARTSALHAFQIEPFGSSAAPMVRFGIHPIPGRTDVAIYCSAPIIDRREVTSSNGERETRCVIRTRIGMGDRTWPIEVTLANRESMNYRMLLGRQAIRAEIHVDPGASFLQPKLGYRIYRHLPRHDLVHRPLRIALLTRAPASASSRRLAAAASSRGHVLEPLDAASIALILEGAEAGLRVRGAAAPHYDAVIPRLGPDDGPFGAAVVRQLEMMGSFALNPGNALDRLLNPIAVRQALIQHGIRGPGAVVTAGAPQTDTRIRASGPRLRLLVIGGDVAAVLERRRGKAYDATGRKLTDERTMAQEAAAAVGLRLAGIEIGASPAGPVVLKVSAVPRLAEFEDVTGVPVADLIITELEARVRSWRRIEPPQVIES